MEIVGTPLTQDKVALLKRVLDSPDQPKGTLQYTELRGFLFAIASAPILVKPSDWIPEVFGGEGPALRNLKQAQAVMAALMACYNETVRAARIEESIEPREVGIDMDSEDSPRDWSRGFVVGFAHLEDVWGAFLEAAPPEETEELEFSFVALTIWADPEGHQKAHGTSDAKHRKLLEGCRKILPVALALVAGTGRSLYEATLATQGPQAEKGSRPKSVGRNDPCPCGSGRKYKNCCLRVH